MKPFCSSSMPGAPAVCANESVTFAALSTRVTHVRVSGVPGTATRSGQRTRILHASPTPSFFDSAWSALGTSGQSSSASGTPSPSRSFFKASHWPSPLVSCFGSAQRQPGGSCAAPEPEPDPSQASAGASTRSGAALDPAPTSTFAASTGASPAPLALKRYSPPGSVPEKAPDGSATTDSTAPPPPSLEMSTATPPAPVPSVFKARPENGTLPAATSASGSAVTVCAPRAVTRAPCTAAPPRAAART